MSKTIKEQLEDLSGLYLDEPQTMDELFGDKPSEQFDKKNLDEFIKKKCDEQIAKTLKSCKVKEEEEAQERRSARNINNAISGTLAIWGLIGVIMVCKSCVNMDSGPKFKV